MATHKATINIKASTQQVFDAITKPGLVKLWQYEKVLTTDWKPGHEIRFSTVFEGKVLEQWGTVLEMRPNELITYNLFTPKAGLEDHIENYNTTSYILTAVNDHTTIEIIQEQNSPDTFIPISLKPILVSLKQVAESLN